LASTAYNSDELPFSSQAFGSAPSAIASLTAWTVSGRGGREQAPVPNASSPFQIRALNVGRYDGEKHADRRY
jgi:hypothetical protein